MYSFLHPSSYQARYTAFPLGHTLGGALSEVIQPKQALALAHSSIKMLLYYCRNYKSTVDLGVMMRVVE